MSPKFSILLKITCIAHKYSKHWISSFCTQADMRTANMRSVWSAYEINTLENTQAKTTSLTTLTVIPSDHFISTGNCFIYLLSLFRFIFNLSFLRVNSPWPSAFIMRSWKKGGISTSNPSLYKNSPNMVLLHHAWNIPCESLIWHLNQTWNLSVL